MIFALTFAGLLLFLGLVVDGGIIYFERRKVQAAADAGAYSGALELLHNNDSWVTDSAKADTKINGFDDDENSVVITVNNPPVSGAAAGDSNAVEVIVQSTVKTTLMQLVADGSSIVPSPRSCRRWSRHWPYVHPCVKRIGRRRNRLQRHSRYECTPNVKS